MDNQFHFEFGDRRLDRRAEQLMGRLIDRQKAVIHQLGDDWAEKNKLLSIDA